MLIGKFLVPISIFVCFLPFSIAKVNYNIVEREKKEVHF